MIRNMKEICRICFRFLVKNDVKKRIHPFEIFYLKIAHDIIFYLINVFFIFLRQYYFFYACALSCKNFLFNTTNRQYKSAKRNLSGHGKRSFYFALCKDGRNCGQEGDTS